MNGFVYFIKSASGTMKIGWSADPAKRLQSLQGASSEGLELIGTVPGTREHERFIHKMLAKHCIGGEWFSANDKVREFVAGILGGDWFSFVPADKIEPSNYQAIAIGCAKIINRCAMLCGINSEKEKPDFDRTDYLWGVKHFTLWKYLYRPLEPMAAEYNELLHGVLIAVEASRKELDSAEAFAKNILEEMESGLQEARVAGEKVQQLEAELSSLKEEL